MNHKLRNAGLIAGSLALSVPAFAAGVDVSTVVTTITDQLTPIGLIGAAVLSLIVVIKAWKWVRRAM
jgi:hypothetical protein